MAGRKPRYPRRTSWRGIWEIREGVFRAQIARTRAGTPGFTKQATFTSLARARAWRDGLEKEWDKNLPVQVCENCGGEFKDSRDRFTCSDSCSRERELERQRRTSTSDRTRWHRVEKNISFDGRTYRVFVCVDGDQWTSSHKTLEKARTERDRYLHQQAMRYLKRCPIDGTVFRAGRSDSTYCSIRCQQEARRRGILARPARANASSRREARQIKKAQREARA